MHWLPYMQTSKSKNAPKHSVSPTYDSHSSYQETVIHLFYQFTTVALTSCTLRAT